MATLRVTTANDATSEVPLYAAEDVGSAGFVRRGLELAALFGYPVDTVGFCARE